MTAKKLALIHYALFIARCSGAATLSYVLSGAIGFPHSVWAAMSAVIVSQTKLGDTQSSVSGRIAGTIIGVGVAIAVGLAAETSYLAIGMPVQIALAVAICAAIAHKRPGLRVCMWTVPIVLLTASPLTPIIAAGFYRGSEVVLGGVVGGIFHLVTERIVTILDWNQEETEDHPPSSRSEG
jgi:uncharacterized membrane protein YgaE (UPF0421/DUF939 family)